jgi:hypothetical protein
LDLLGDSVRHPLCDGVNIVSAFYQGRRIRRDRDHRKLDQLPFVNDRHLLSIYRVRPLAARSKPDGGGVDEPLLYFTLDLAGKIVVLVKPYLGKERVVFSPNRLGSANRHAARNAVAVLPHDDGVLLEIMGPGPAGHDHSAMPVNVVVVDLDGNGPTLSVLFGLPNPNGD